MSSPLGVGFACQAFAALSDNYGSRRDYYAVNLGTGDIKYLPTKFQAPTEVEAVIARQSRNSARRTLDREYDTNYLSSHEAHLFKKRL